MFLHALYLNVYSIYQARKFGLPGSKMAAVAIYFSIFCNDQINKSKCYHIWHLIFFEMINIVDANLPDWSAPSDGKKTLMGAV